MCWNLRIYTHRCFSFKAYNCSVVLDNYVFIIPGLDCVLGMCRRSNITINMWMKTMWSRNHYGVFITMWKVGHIRQYRKTANDAVFDAIIELKSLWRHQMETFSALLAICAVNSPAQRLVTRSFDVFVALRLNKGWGWWFETPSRPLWRHSNGESHGMCTMTWWDINTHWYRIQYTVSYDIPRTLLRQSHILKALLTNVNPWKVSVLFAFEFQLCKRRYRIYGSEIGYPWVCI